jgi:hypothetical protein
MSDALDPAATTAAWRPTSNTYLNDIDIKKQMDFGEYTKDMPKPELGKDWIGEEYKKHTEELRNRYPLLQQMLLRNEPQNTANRSTLENTDKYARLADAYNAQMRYKPSGISVGYDDYTMGTGDSWEKVPELKTQDQKQADFNRETQGAVRDYILDQEQAFQQDYWKRKGDEVQQLVDQGYQQQFFNANEQMRRVKSLFDSWKDMNEQTYLAFMNKIGVSAAQAREARKLLDAGDYVGYAHLMQAEGLTPMGMDQIYSYTTAGPILQQLLSKQIDGPTAARALGKLNADYAVQAIAGIFDSAKDAPQPEVREIAAKGKQIIDGVLKAGGNVADHLTEILVGLGALEGVKGIGGFLVAIKKLIS